MRKAGFSIFCKVPGRAFGAQRPPLQLRPVNHCVLTVATRNAHKTREIQEILGAEYVVQDLSTRADVPEIAETGTTFKENAILKAVTVSRCVPGFVVADDSGLEVDVLGGAPGVYSARYAGEPGDDLHNIEKLLAELNAVDPKEQQRQARFRCVLAVARDGKLLKTFTGTIEGKIADSPRGKGGFGYDPVFVPDGFDETFAELPLATKNDLSHRAVALTAALPFFKAARQTS
jgi:XTP/dITP diphosphohydrolase